eukprot:3587093-Alexandrium_andersonii.AAC.1
MAPPPVPWVHPCCRWRDRLRSRRSPRAPPDTSCSRCGRLRGGRPLATTAAPSSTGTSAAASATTTCAGRATGQSTSGGGSVEGACVSGKRTDAGSV